MCRKLLVMTPSRATVPSRLAHDRRIYAIHSPASGWQCAPRSPHVTDTLVSSGACAPGSDVPLRLGLLLEWSPIRTNLLSRFATFTVSLILLKSSLMYRTFLSTVLTYIFIF